ncbi:MAG TPA: hypothetical protein VJ981_00795, partial [Gammaproteobacteria bacterium]|nr:hypothetical protein [Gammaproteobacteria bacterium]
NAIELVEFIPVFHRWIQDKALAQTLIDAADYSHVQEGPGIVLVAHEGNYSIDETGNRRGLVYYSKHEMPEADLQGRLQKICMNALAACSLIEQDSDIDGRMTFPGNELQVFANDRLRAPNTDETWSSLEPVINEFLGRLFDGKDYSLERETDPAERFQVTVKAQEPVAVNTLLQRLSG